MIDEAVMTQKLLAELHQLGWNGSKLPQFCSAIAGGFAQVLAGTSFTTTDTGVVAGTGSGTGTGLTITGGIVETEILSLGYTGPEFQSLASAVASWAVDVGGDVEMDSTHSPVFQGSGGIVSVLILASDIESAILSMSGFTGSDWPGLVNAISSGLAQAYSVGVGSVVITGTGAPGSPGQGTGSGVLK